MQYYVGEHMKTDKTGPSKERARAATTSEIARISGVSRSTVSAVLTGKRRVRESTRRKVLESIRQKNYGTGMVARSLISQLSTMVAVLAPNLGSPFHMMFFRGVNDVVDREGYHVLFHNVRGEDREDPETYASLRSYRPAGYIILKGAEGMQCEHARRIQEDGIPLVMESALRDSGMHSVAFDNRGAMKLAADYLIARGHRRIAHLAGPTFSLGAKERKLGVVECLIDHNIPLTDAPIVHAGETAPEGYMAALNVLKAPVRPTALLCFNDMVAMGAYRAAHELGLSIPHDLSVVGFDGIDVAELLGPPLTTVDIQPQALGRRAATLLLKVIRNEVGRAAVTESVEARLVERGSVASIAPTGGTSTSDGARRPIETPVA